MRMKQITAATMQEALHIARRDLGDEAVLLETRKLSGNRGVTVVFAIDEPDSNLFESDNDNEATFPTIKNHPLLARQGAVSSFPGVNTGRGAAKDPALHGSHSPRHTLRHSGEGRDPHGKNYGSASTNDSSFMHIDPGLRRDDAPRGLSSHLGRDDAHHEPRPRLHRAEDNKARPAKNHPAFDIIEQALESHATPPAIAEKIMAAVHASPPQAGGIKGGGAVLDAAESILTEALSKQLKFSPLRTGEKNYPDRAVMLVGAHGAGKTSAIAKLATQLTLLKRKVVLISTDTERLGGADALQNLSDILKCELHVINKRALLRELVKQNLGTAWVLIDSFGVNIYEFNQMKAIGELAGLQGIEPILTCPADMDAEEAQEMAGVFSFLPIERIIVTRTDSSRRLSSLFAILQTGGHALANMSSSAKPSEACNPLSAPTLSRLMLRRAREKMGH